MSPTSTCIASAASNWPDIRYAAGDGPGLATYLPALRRRATRSRLLMLAVVIIAAPAIAGCGGASKEAAPASSGAAGSSAEVLATGTGDTGVPNVAANRSVISTGDLKLTVESVSNALEGVRQIALAAGGMVTDSSFTGEGDDHSAQLTLRVPADRFADVVARLQGLAVKVPSVTMKSTDVSGEVTDIEATLRNLRAVEAQYQQLLGRANSIGDVLQVQDRLNQVRLQIDRTEARRQYLASQSEMATLMVSLHAKGTSAGGPLATARKAWAASLRTLEMTVTVVIAIVVYSWWLIPTALVVAWLVARQNERIRRLASRLRDAALGQSGSPPPAAG